MKSCLMSESSLICSHEGLVLNIVKCECPFTREDVCLVDFVHLQKFSVPFQMRLCTSDYEVIQNIKWIHIVCICNI